MRGDVPGLHDKFCSSKSKEAAASVPEIVELELLALEGLVTARRLAGRLGVSLALSVYSPLSVLLSFCFSVSRSCSVSAHSSPLSLPHVSGGANAEAMCRQALMTSTSLLVVRRAELQILLYLSG